MIIVDWKLALGWLLGWSCLLVLGYFREKFYTVLLSGENFSVKKYVSYIVFVFIILWIPLLLAFMFPQVINPYAIAGAYITDRFLLFVTGIFKKEGSV
ncbi:MAG: hypothetical protein RR565_02755 [Erysipelothrix sp.]